MHASVAFIIDIAGAKQRSALAAADRPFSSIHSTARQMVFNRYEYRGRTYAFLLVLTIASGSKNSIRRVPPAVCPSVVNVRQLRTTFWLRTKGKVLLFPEPTDSASPGNPVESRQRLGDLLRYYARAA